MFKKIATLVVSFVISIVSVAGLAACGNSDDKVEADPLTLNVRIHEAGYGTSYIYALKEKFEQTFASKNYKLNVLAPKTDIGDYLIFQDIYANSGVDVYIAGCRAEDSATGEYSDNGANPVFAELNENVFEKKPIGFDGNEEDVTVKDKLQAYNFNRATFYDGKYYGIPVALSVSGYAVNQKVLSDNGLEIPITTNDLQNCIDVIMKKAANEINNGTVVYDVVKPFAYSLKGNNYAIGAANAWFAQYSGKTAFDKFWSFTDNGREMVEDCYETFNDDGIKEMFELMFEVYDKQNAAHGFASQDFRSAQAQLMLGKAAFCPTGDWMLNEEVATYPKEAEDITFIKIPLISALGTKLFGASTDYACNDENCEKLLKLIAKCADENMEVSQIKSEVLTETGINVKDEDVQTVCESRGYMRDVSSESAYISSKSTKKEIAYEFLRFLASDDGAKLFSEESNTTSPFAVGKMDGAYDWHDNVNKITSNRYFGQLVGESTGYRLKLGLTDMFYKKYYIASIIQEENVTIYDWQTLKKLSGKSRNEYITKADAFYNAIYEDAKNCATVPQANGKTIWSI